jgi:hypothetical protein
MFQERLTPKEKADRCAGIGKVGQHCGVQGDASEKTVALIWISLQQHDATLPTRVVAGEGREGEEGAGVATSMSLTQMPNVPILFCAGSDLMTVVWQADPIIQTRAR